MSARGFTLLELLIAAALLLTLASAVASLSVPIGHAVQRTAGASDQTTTVRSTLERLTADVRGAGRDAALARSSLALVTPTIVIREGLDGVPTSDEGQAITLVTVPDGAAHARLAAVVAPGAVQLHVDTATCPRPLVHCGFDDDTPVVIYDGARSEFATVIARVGADRIRLAAPLTAAFDEEAVVSAVSRVSYGVRPKPDGTMRLVRATPDSEQPLVAEVVAFGVSAEAEDAWRVRRVDLRLRVQVADAALRGPPGRWFARAGSALLPSLWVPDLEMRVSIAPRNLPW